MQKILIDEMPLSIEWLYYIINGICADGEHVNLKEEQKCSDSSVVRG